MIILKGFDNMKVVLFGDSLTFGYGVWPKDNIEHLLKNCYKDTEFINSGVNGDTTREAAERFENDVLKFNPDIVTFLFGSNDSAMGEGAYRTLYEYRLNLQAMVEEIRLKNKDCKIIMITPPPVDDTVFMPWTYNDRLAPYCSTVREISYEYNTYLADFNKHLSGIEDLTLYLQEDGCHLSEKGYVEFFNCLKGVLDTINI